MHKNPLQNNKEFGISWHFACENALFNHFVVGNVFTVTSALSCDVYLEWKRKHFKDYFTDFHAQVLQQWSSPLASNTLLLFQ